VPADINPYVVYHACKSYKDNPEAKSKNSCWQNWSKVPDTCKKKRTCWKQRCNAEGNAVCAAKALATAKKAKKAAESVNNPISPDTYDKPIRYYEQVLNQAQMNAQQAYMCGGTPLWIPELKP